MNFTALDIYNKNDQNYRLLRSFSATCATLSVL